MKIKRAFLLQVILFSVLFITLPGEALFAQGLPCPEGCTGPNCEFCKDPSTIPLDGGVVSILVAGMMLGVLIMYKQNKFSRQNQ